MTISLERLKNIFMKFLTTLLITAVFTTTILGCGVKGKPQAPLKKGETKNEPARKQNP